MTIPSRLAAAAITGLLLAVSLAAVGAAAPERALVTLRDARDADDVRASRSGVEWTPLSDSILLASGPGVRHLARDPRVASVEPDRAVRAAVASWDRAGWDTASWDRASWDRASWDTASWDRASWDRASWDRASWDRASWDRASWDGIGSSGAFAASQWGLAALDAPVAPPAPSNVVVCVADSGVDASHPQLADRLWRDASGSPGRDFVEGDALPDDDAGHGTHVAGIVAAGGDGPMRGVSGARVASAKILGADGFGLTSDLVRALEWCVDIDADIVLLALTEDAPTRALDRALTDVRRAGLLIVASAGNVGPCERCVVHPASHPAVLAAGALDPDLRPSAFGASGPEVDLALPGRLVLSTYPGGWRVGSGTSQAAAFLAGSVALIAAETGLDVQAAARLLERDARDLGRPGEDAATGAGIPQISASLARGGA